MILIKNVNYPVIHLSSWVEKLMLTHPEFLLGGFQLHDEDGWRSMLSDFWRWFAGVDGDHPVHARSETVKQTSIPIAIHGDEGRGLAKIPLMVWSYQLIIPSTGPNCLNSTQYLSIVFSRVLVLSVMQRGVRM